jgi:tetratricopeptide (TPR) repeat protein
MVSGRVIRLCAWVVLFGVVLIVFLPCTANDFVNWDDLIFVVYNPAVAQFSGKSFSWAFTTFHQGIWHPVTWLSHTLCRSLCGLNPGCHHLASVLIHGLNVLLFCLLFLRLMEVRDLPPDSRRIAAFAAAVLFGVDPLCVEATAWVSARKDLLCAFFSLGSLIAYLRYVRSDSSRGRQARYLFSVFLAALALMSKPSAMTLPFVLLIIDFHPLERLERGSIGKRIWEKLPFFALAFGAAALNMAAAGAHAISFSYVPLHMRIMNAFYAVFFYIRQSLVPTNLLPLYQLDRGLDYFGPVFLGTAALFVLVTVSCVGRALKGDRIWAASWFAYLTLLLPVLGLFMSHRQGMADRYAYLPTMVIWMLVGLGIARVWQRAGESRRRGLTRAVLAGCFVVVACLYGYAAQRQIGVWRNSETLWRYMMEHADYVPALAYLGLGQELENRGELDEALALYRKAFSLNPRNNDYLGRIGVILAKKGRSGEALAIFTKIRDQEPADPKAHLNVARALLQAGRTDESIAAMKKAEELDPNGRDLLLLLTIANLRRGDGSTAAKYYGRYLAAGHVPRPDLEARLGLRPAGKVRGR